MDYFSTALLFVAGLSSAFGLMYLFIGIRRPNERPANLAFSLFAFSYAGATLAAESAYTSSTVAEYIAASRWTGLFASAGFASLVWFVAYYTRVAPRPILWTLTAVFATTGFVTVFAPDLLYVYTGDVTLLHLPWGETVFVVGEADAPILPLVIVAQLAVIAYILYACARQYRSGRRQAAVALAMGAAWFVFTIIGDILVAVGQIDFVYLSDFGFLGFAVAMSLQMANTSIRAEEQLTEYRLNLEDMVVARTAELESAQVRLLEQAQVQAVESERRRLARDLHDVVSQILFSINLIAISLPRLWQRDPDMAERSTTELQRLTRGAMSEMRTLLRELRPQTIVSTDIGTLLNELGDGIGARHDIPVDMEIDSDLDLPGTVHVALYRIAQEALNNVAKHAEPSYLAVRLGRANGSIALTIADDGIGFVQGTLTPSQMGLDIMRERAESIGGELSITSQPGAGTTIVATCPVADVHRDAHAEI